jgi:hypothetical protein
MLRNWPWDDKSAYFVPDFPAGTPLFAANFASTPWFGHLFPRKTIDIHIRNYF